MNSDGLQHKNFKLLIGLAPLFVLCALIGVALSACNLYSSSDRKSFNSGAESSSSAKNQNASEASAQYDNKTQDDHASSNGTHLNPRLRLTLGQRTHCTQVESAAPLLLRGVDIVHAAEAWNIETDDRTQTNRFVWARRSETAAGVVCLIEPLSDYELQHTLPRLPILAAHLSASLP